LQAAGLTLCQPIGPKTRGNVDQRMQVATLQTSAGPGPYIGYCPNSEPIVLI